MIRFLITLCFLFLAVSANADDYWQQWHDVKERQPLHWNMGRAFSDKDIENTFHALPVTNFKKDWNIYGVNEYWATPDEFEKNSGDCEDAVIWWAYKLAALGTGRLQIAIGLQGVVPHAVLVVNDKWVLDINERAPVLLREYKATTLDEYTEVL